MNSTTKTAELISPSVKFRVVRDMSSHPAAGHRKYLAGNIPTFVTGQKQYRVCDIFDSADATQRNLFLVFRHDFRPDVTKHGGLHHAGRDSIHSNLASSQFLC